MEPIRLVVADDHAVVRSGLRLLLEAEDGFGVVAEAGEIDTWVRGWPLRRRSRPVRRTT